MKYFKTTDEKAIGFWTIVTNLMVIIFTFWLGIVVQSMVAKKNADVSSTLASIEYVEKVKPLTDSLNVKYGTMLMEFSTIFSEKTINRSTEPSESEKVIALEHFNKYNDKYADFFHDIAFTFARIYEFDHNCSQDVRAAACALPFLSPLIKNLGALYENNNSSSVVPRNDWPRIEDTIRKIVQQPDYIKSFGLLLGDLNGTINELQKIYFKSIESNDTKNMLVMFSETEALKVLSWIQQHSYYTAPKDTSIIGKIVDYPALSFIFLGLLAFIIALVIYKSHHWTKSSKKNSDISLEKMASNIEELRKENHISRQNVEKVVMNLEESIPLIKRELSVLATPIYDKIYEQERHHVDIMLEIINKLEDTDSIPPFNEDKTLFGQERYDEIVEYRKMLEAYFKEKGIEIPAR